MKLKQGDKIVVTVGKDKGREGKIDSILGKKEKVLVPGINMFKKHMRKTEKSEGGIIEFTRSLPIANVALVCPECGKPTRVGYTLVEKKKERMCKKCKKII